MKKFARKCDECKKLFNEGFCIEGGQNYYCSEECLHINISKKEYKHLYDFGDSYFTVWEDEDDFQYYEDGTEVNP